MATTGSHVDSEDTVQYWLFPNLEEGDDQRDQLETFRTKCFSFLHDQSRDYIWHEESISLCVTPTTGKYIYINTL